MNSAQQYIDLYTEHKDLLAQGSHQLVNACRDEALETLRHLGLPSLRDERYKYTDVQKVLAPDYGLNISRLDLHADPSAAYRCRVPDMGSRLFYVVNDRIEGKDGLVDQDSLFVGHLTDFAQRHPEVFKAYYNKVEHDGLTALNTMLAQDGVVIYVADGNKVETPLQIVNLVVGNVPMMTNRRVLVILGQQAEATLVLCDHSLTKEQHLTTEVAEIYLMPGSKLSLHDMEETHEANSLLSTTNIVMHQDSELAYTSATLTNGLTRHTIDVHLAGAGARAQLSGLVIGGGSQHVDNNLLVSHEAERCQSDILYKYVLNGQSKGAFAGKVYVAPGAQKTDSQETNANLCVSPQAHMYTQPMLEIYADDVKCNHGSTVGQLDEAALFYMAQRGIEPADGRRLLQQAFAYEVIDRIEVPALRQRLAQMVSERLRREAGACGDCSICSTR